MSALPVVSPPPEERSSQLDRVLVSAFLENIPDKVFFKDRQGRFMAVSRSCVRQFGATSATYIIGRTDFDFFCPTHAQRMHEAEQRILRTGEPMLNQVEREVWPDGRVTWSLTSKMPVRDESRVIIGTFGISKDITRRREMELALEKAHRELVDASRIVGRAEVANGVLHKVGTILNSLNVSASVLADGLRRSRVDSLAKLAALLRAHQADLGVFLTTDPKGRRIPELIASLAAHAIEERDRLLKEIVQLQNKIDHIKEIVSMQQAYASMAGVIETLEPETLFEDALRVNAEALGSGVQIARDFQFVSGVLGEKPKVLQILVNLIQNAKDACDAAASAEKRITLRIRPAGTSERVCLVVEDNGVGIPAENLTRIFSHGFTTRPGGHGFALHSAANAANEMKGRLTVESPGPGRGAIFTLELPLAPPAVPVE